MRISDWSSYVCSSDLVIPRFEIDVRLTIDVIIYNQRNVITGSKRRDRASVAVVEYEAQPVLLNQLRPTPELGCQIRKHDPTSEESSVGKAGARTGVSRWWPSTVKKLNKPTNKK